MAKELKLPQLSTQQIQILAGTVIGCALFGFVYWNYFWSPISVDIKKDRKEIVDIKNEIAKAGDPEETKKTVTVELNDLKKRKKTAKRSLPENKDISGLIKILTALGRQYNIEIHSISPRGTKQATYYAKVLYGLSLTGTYHSIGRFITALGTLDRIFSTENLRISGNVDGSAKADLILVAYQYKR